ncbi:Sex peptide receptor [Halotydeus destructor]|nr:Sex peptide receptor [Halotydeus destructor]
MVLVGAATASASSADSYGPSGGPKNTLVRIPRGQTIDVQDLVQRVLSVIDLPSSAPSSSDYSSPAAAAAPYAAPAAAAPARPYATPLPPAAGPRLTITKTIRIRVPRRGNRRVVPKTNYGPRTMVMTMRMKKRAEPQLVAVRRSRPVAFGGMPPLAPCEMRELPGSGSHQRAQSVSHGRSHAHGTGFQRLPNYGQVVRDPSRPGLYEMLDKLIEKQASFIVNMDKWQHSYHHHSSPHLPPPPHPPPLHPIECDKTCHHGGDTSRLQFERASCVPNTHHIRLWLLDFRDTYTGYVHGYLAIVVCVFGILTNLVNIVVLTRKEMATATNAILTGLAVADLLVMASYVPFAFHHYVDHSTSSSASARFSYRWTLFTLVHAHVTVVGHAVSTWLTVLLAVWRYLSVRFPTESRNWLTMGAAKWAILATYLAVPVLCIPVYVSFNIYRKGGPGGDSEGDDGSDYYYYVVNFSQVSLRNNQLLKRVNFWLFSVFLKIVPCILLTFLSKALISALLEAERRKRRLKTQTCFSLTATSPVLVGKGFGPLGQLHLPLRPPRTGRRTTGRRGCCWPCCSSSWSPSSRPAC